MPSLQEVLRGLQPFETRGDVLREITGIQYDSRQVAPGNLFVCIPGLKTDGHNFVPQAVAAGAVALLVERDVATDQGVAVVKVADTRKALPVVASNFYGAPSRDLRVIGVTGTNGKTTTTHLVAAILEEAGFPVGLIGTLYARWGGVQEAIANTTPESVDLERFFHKVRREGGKYVVMEVSSHALDLGRVDQIDFDVALFTNLTQDHLDYHHTLEDYLRAKLVLFRMLDGSRGKLAVINADDPHSSDFSRAARCRTITYGLGRGAEVRAVDVNVESSGSAFTAVWPGGSLPIALKLAGNFNVYNALAAIAFALGEGIEPAIIKQGLERVAGVPGRFESVACGQDFTVIVDYAHTPDGLKNILQTAQRMARGRIITVFGCGGDRDRGKRPLMGEIAARYSDFTIVTSDNPRTEEPMAIIEDILPGVNRVKDCSYAVVVDRREAIRQAVSMAAKDDIVIIAGKGHETYQLVKGEVFPFDDREVAREFLRGRLRNE